MRNLGRQTPPYETPYYSFTIDAPGPCDAYISGTVVDTNIHKRHPTRALHPKLQDYRL